MKIIGMIHLDTLPGYPQHESMDSVVEHALHDARQLQEGGVDSILLENTNDDPHQELLGPEQISSYTVVAREVKEKSSLPFGICCLFNDYRSALAIAKVTGAEYVRIPVFTEAIVASLGIIEANPYDAIAFRDKIDGNEIRILADVKVKHASSLSTRPIEESAMDTLGAGADELIITGRYTGDCPLMKDLQAVREALPQCLINIGSGTNSDNINELAKYADAAIVGTYFKVDRRMNASRVQSLRKMVQ